MIAHTFPFTAPELDFPEPPLVHPAILAIFSTSPVLPSLLAGLFTLMILRGGSGQGVGCAVEGLISSSFTLILEKDWQVTCRETLFGGLLVSELSSSCSFLKIETQRQSKTSPLPTDPHEGVGCP